MCHVTNRPAKLSFRRSCSVKVDTQEAMSSEVSGRKNGYKGEKN